MEVGGSVNKSRSYLGLTSISSLSVGSAHVPESIDTKVRRSYILQIIHHKKR